MITDMGTPSSHKMIGMRRLRLGDNCDLNRPGDSAIAKSGATFVTNLVRKAESEPSFERYWRAATGHTDEIVQAPGLATRQNVSSIAASPSHRERVPA